MQTCREATVLHYAPALDPHLQRIAELADRAFCILRFHWRRRASLVETEPMNELAILLAFRLAMRL